MLPKFGQSANPYLLMGGYGQTPNPLAQVFATTDLATPSASGAPQSVVPQIADAGGFQVPTTNGITDVGVVPGITGVMGGLNTPAVADKGMFGGMLGSTDANGVRTDGWGGMAVGAASGLVNAFMGMKQYGLAKEQLAEGKRQYDANYAAQRTTTNASLEDRQRARVASNSGAYQSVGDYMNKNGIK